MVHRSRGFEGRGVTFPGETLAGGVCHAATFADPDGGDLTLHNR